MEGSQTASTGSGAASGASSGAAEALSLSLSPSRSGTRSAYEKLQALALAEHLSSESPPPPIDLADVMGDDGADLQLVADNDEDDAEDAESTYEVTWSGGQLGLLFKASPGDRAVIRRVNKKGAATGLGYARAGDVLVALNGESVEHEPFLAVIARLKSPQFPVRLEFRPLQMNELAPAASAAPLASAPAAAPASGVTSPTPSNKTVDLRQQHVADDSYVVVPHPGEEAVSMAMERDGGGGGGGGDDDDEYDVVWDEGPLGCELKQRNGLPTVKSVTGTGTTPSVAQIAAGDVLVGINGLRTDEIGFKSTVTLMMRATKPVYLRFHRARTPLARLEAAAARAVTGSAAPTPLEPQQYTVLWREGPLGIQIRTSSKGHVVVSRLTGVGDPVQLDQVSPGDMFVRIAGVEVDALGIAGAFDLLKSVKKPVVLVFQKRRGSSRRARRPKDETVGGAVPSFRQLREEWATQQQQQQQQQQQHLPPRPTITRAHSNGQPQPGPSRWSRLERAGSAQMFAASFAAPRGGDPFGLPAHADLDAFSEGDASQRSYDPGDLGYDLASPRQSDSIDADGERPPPPAYMAFGGELPDAPAPTGGGSVDRCDDDDGDGGDGDGASDLPPPSYTDIFTQSGRPRESLAPPPPPPPPPPSGAQSADFTRLGAAPASPRSDVYSVSSEMTPAEYRQQPQQPQQPQNPYGGALPPSFDMGLPLPPPPEYTPGLGISNARTRLQELRMQYLESERMRNQSGDGYSFADAGAALGPAPAFDLQSDAAASLPAPELQIRWADGPLGITFKRKHGRIVVSRLTGQGHSPGLGQLRPGDWFVSFNGRPTQDLRLSQTMELLKRESKPVVMCFVVQ